jgi:hypothetical protein
MAFSVSPSVIVREVDASQVVPAIATPPAAIAGVFGWGPTDETILITSENQLVDRYGKPTDSNYETWFTAADYLAYSNALYVHRASTTGAASADADTVVLFTADTAYANTAANTYVEGVTPGSIGTVDSANSIYGAFEAKYEGALGNSIDVAYVKAGSYESDIFDAGDIENQTILFGAGDVRSDQVTQEIEFASTTTTFQSQDTNITGLGDGDLVTIGNDSVGYQNLTVSSFSKLNIGANGSILSDDDAANTALFDPAATVPIGTYQYTITFDTKYTLAETELNKLSMKRKWKHASLFGKSPDTNNYHIAVIDRGGSITGNAGTVLEKFENISTAAGATLSDGRTNYYETVIENLSSWVNVANTAAFLAGTSEYETLSDGADGTAEGSASFGPVALAYDNFANANEIDISFVLQGKGDDNGQIANYIIGNIADSRRDCVAFVSPSKEAVVDELKTNSKLSKAIAYRNKVTASSYMVMDSGYKYRYDKYNDVYRWTPLNGDMAGLCSRVQPFESPAGYRKGVIKNVIKLAFNPNKAQRDQLYSSDINPVISQVGQGILLFGDKTGQGFASAFDRINVRRLFIAVEKSIATAAQSFLFELNDEFTQTQFRNIVEPFLREIQGRRGIIDFRVVSDETVNTPQVIDSNMFKASIFIKPARSINVIELTFVATRSGVEFDEIVGQLT